MVPFSCFVTDPAVEDKPGSKPPSGAGVDDDGDVSRALSLFVIVISIIVIIIIVVIAANARVRGVEFWRRIAASHRSMQLIAVRCGVMS